MTGDTFTPGQALEMGLINAIVPHDKLMAAARDLARRIMRHSPDAARSIITAVTRGLNMTIGEGLRTESEQFARLVPTRSLAENLNTWIERKAIYAPGAVHAYVLGFTLG